MEIKREERYIFNGVSYATMDEAIEAKRFKIAMDMWQEEFHGEYESTFKFLMEEKKFVEKMFKAMDNG
jgi:hypothetical protein